MLLTESSSSRRRVTLAQLESLWELLHQNKSLATGFNKSAQARADSKNLWMRAAELLNSHGDGAVKDWKGWCKYWNDYKSKIKIRLSALRASNTRTGGGPADAKPLTEIEKKFVLLLGDDFGSGLAGARVEPFHDQTEMETQPGTSSEVHHTLSPPLQVHVVEDQTPSISNQPPLSPVTSVAETHTASRMLRTPQRSPRRRRRLQRETPLTQVMARRQLIQLSERRLANEEAGLGLLRTLVEEIREIKKNLSSSESSPPNMGEEKDTKIVQVQFTPPYEKQESTVKQNRQQAVCVRHAFKHYGSKKRPNHVLSNLNMTVAKGTIYGLLGASGCGKTTLLSCIVGRRKLNNGEIWVLGGKPGTKGSGVPGKRVGYMPQEIALYGEFTIKETMMYFGWIFGMETKEILDRLRFLLEFLDLPFENRMVKNLSGGQQRRVSFAVALMHDPELLILDEPTVGVDPLLRQSIWTHLVRITSSGDKTVIITTHYIEEARQAHCIGLMRSGRLLAEESPQSLLTMYNCVSLEDVFLKLSRKQGQSNQVVELNVSGGALGLNKMSKREEAPYAAEDENVVGLVFHQSKEVLIADQLNGQPNLPGKVTEVMTTECEECGDCFNLTTRGKIKALIQKNFLRMWRNIGVMLFIFVLPVMQVILFCLAIGRDPSGLRLAIVNHDVMVNNGNCPYNNTCSMKNLSCRYLAHLKNQSIIKEYYSSVEEALGAVRRGEAWGALYFNENYTDSLVARLALADTADNETIESSEVQVWLDMSNQQIGLMLNRDIQFSYRDFAKDLLETCGYNPKVGDIPIDFMDPIYGDNNPSFTDFVAPGVILTIVFFLAVALTSSALIVERMEGLLDRSWVAGVSPGEILLSHVITQFVVMCGQTALVLLFMILVFGVECNGNVAYVVMLTLLQGLCGMCFGFVISAACELERNAIQLALGSFYPTLLLSGVIWPIEGMPWLLRGVSTCLPLTLATTALRCVLTRGWPLSEPAVYMGFVSTLVWISLFLALTLTILRFKRG